ncbi:MAG: hypothetical protein HS116_22560 [Planctomycetes bacterium]|nr:hypothetical protein [Planctomycetota bacterium]
MTAWFRDTLRTSFKDEMAFRKDLTSQLRRRETDLEAKKGRLLDLFLAGDVPKEDYQKKSDELRIEIEGVRRQMAEDIQVHQDYSELAVKVFDLTQKAAETWLGSCNSVRRELLEIMFTNRDADELSLRMTWRCPFSEVAKTAILGDGVADRT